MKKQSPAFQFIELMYREQGDRLGRSKERFHAGMWHAAHAAIQFGLKFELDDVANLAKQQSPSYGNTSIYRPDETDYRLACGSERGRESPSFCLSFEKWMGRKPFLIADPDAKTPTRVYVGRKFEWYGTRVECTSFAKDHTYLTAVSHKLSDDRQKLEVGCVAYFHSGYRRLEKIEDDGRIVLSADNVHANFENKIDKRFSIDHVAIREFGSSRKILAEVKTVLGQLPAEKRSGVIDWYRKEFGEVRETTLKLDQLQKVLETLKAA